MNLTKEDVRDILRLLDSTHFDELHLETESFRLMLRRGGAGEWSQATQLLSTPAMAEVETPPTQKGGAPQPGAELPRDPSPANLEDILEVRAPLLGVFYRAPKPGAAPFVVVGSHVEADTVVAIIETMKLMNSVHAGVRGSVVEICLADAQFVTQDAVVMRIAPDAT